jgi:hypothetical protein
MLQSIASIIRQSSGRAEAKRIPIHPRMSVQFVQPSVLASKSKIDPPMRACFCTSRLDF